MVRERSGGVWALPRKLPSRTSAQKKPSPFPDDGVRALVSHKRGEKGYKGYERFIYCIDISVVGPCRSARCRRTHPASAADGEGTFLVEPGVLFRAEPRTRARASGTHSLSDWDPHDCFRELVELLLERG